MWNGLLISAGLVLAAGAALAQTPAPGPAFEVASVKPAAPLDRGQMLSGQMHVGMKIDAARVDIGGMSLADLIRVAYRVKPYQVSGPDWMASERFDVLAKLPEGASREQVPEMLQALLAERFKLTVHRESKEHAVYALVVGKNGPKLKESAPDADAPAGGDAPAALDVHVSGRGENTQVSISGGQIGTAHMSMGPNGIMRLEAPKMNMAALADTALALFRPPGGGSDRVERNVPGGAGPFDGGFPQCREDHRHDGAGHGWRQRWDAAAVGCRIRSGRALDFRGGAAARPQAGTTKRAARPDRDRSLGKDPHGELAWGAAKNAALRQEVDCAPSARGLPFQYLTAETYVLVGKTMSISARSTMSAATYSRFSAPLSRVPAQPPRPTRLRSNCRRTTASFHLSSRR